jgi:hypothetical protein
MAGSPDRGRVRDAVDIDHDGGGVHGTDHFTHPATDAAIQDNWQGSTTSLGFQTDGGAGRALVDIPGWRGAVGALGEADLDGALAETEIAEFQVIGMVRHRDGRPAIDGVIAQLTAKRGPSRHALEALAQNRQTGPWPRQPGQTHARLGGVIDVVGEGAGRAGQDALKAIAGKVAGLVAGLDVGATYADPVGQIGEKDGLDRTDLDALATLDAGG